MQKNLMLCVDLVTLMKEEDLKVMDSRKGTLFRNEEDKFTFTEKDVKPHEEHPELHWRLLDRTKHGRIHLNSRHVKVEFYIRHEDYRNGNDLADILAREVETMGESLCDICLSEEVEKCC
jgi:hypothetical protein